MPKEPIIERVALFQRLRDNTLRQLDWNIVETSLGKMLEPRAFFRADSDDIKNVDVYDANYTSIRILDAGAFANEFQTDGIQFPSDFNTQ